MLSVYHLRDARIASTKKSPLNFQLYPGSLLFVKGENGCGKSTLLKLITGLRPPSDDTNITIHFDYSYLGSQNGLLKGARVSDYVLSHDFIPAFYTNKLMSHLSSGMQRRVALAHVMQRNKKLWIMDEPTSYLDAAAQEQFYHDIFCHVQLGGAALIATHDNPPKAFSEIGAQVLNLGGQHWNISPL